MAATTIYNITTGTSSIPAAVADAVWGRTDCSVAPVGGTDMLTCPHTTGSGTFSAANQNQKVILDDLGSGLGQLRPPFVTQLPAVIPSPTDTVALAANPTHTTALAHIYTLSVSTPGANYSFGGTERFSWPVGNAVPALGTPGVMTAVGVATNTAGTSSSTNTMCLVQPTTQTAVNGAVSQFLVSTNATGGITSMSMPSIRSGGTITGDSIMYSGGTYNDPVVGVPSSSMGCVGMTGAVLSISYGVTSERLLPGTGSYNPTTLPCGTAVQAAHITDSGTGMYADCVGYFYSTVSYGTDNTMAFQGAVGLQSSPPAGSMNAGSAVSSPTCVYIPAGNYLTGVTNPAGGFTYAAKGFGCWIGDEHYNSNIFVIPNTAGDMFAWEDANKNNTQIPFGNTQYFSNYQATPANNNQAGSSFRNITIIGNRSSATTAGPALQNGLMFYGKTEFAYIDNWVVSYMSGMGFGAGFQDGSSIGDFNESRVQNGHLDNDGYTPIPLASGTPVATFEINASGADGSNTDTLENLRIFDSWGPSLWISQDGTNTSSDRAIQLVNIVAEGTGMSAQYVQGDLLKFGNNPSGSNIDNVTNIQCRNVELFSPVVGYAALRIAANGTNAGQTQYIDCQGAITSNATSMSPTVTGRGLQIDTCQYCSFKFGTNSAYDYQFVLGSVINGASCSATLQQGTTIQYDGDGAEASLTTCLDPATVGLVRYPVHQFLGNAGLINAQSNPVGDLTSSVSAVGGAPFTVSSGGNFSISPIAPLWIIERTGNQTAPITDTWDSAAHFQTQLNLLSPGFVLSGQLYHARVCNQTTVQETVQPPSSGGTSGSTVVIPPGGCSTFALAFSSSGVNIAGQ